MMQDFHLKVQSVKQVSLVTPSGREKIHYRNWTQKCQIKCFTPHIADGANVSCIIDDPPVQQIACQLCIIIETPSIFEILQQCSLRLWKN